LADNVEASSESDPTPKRRVRPDALRNEDAVLEAAKAVSTELGGDVTASAIAARAGVGMGTL
jgi:AcrR family transcriptional regulator